MTSNVSLPDGQTVRSVTSETITTPEFNYILGLYLAIVLDVGLQTVYFLIFVVITARVIVYGVEQL